MLIKSYIQDPSGKRVEMTADKDIYLKTFTQLHSQLWITFAIDNCSLWSFLYYLYLDLISRYMDKPEFADENHDKGYYVLIERLKYNKIDADTLTFLRDTLRKFMDGNPEIQVGLPKSLKGVTLEDEPSDAVMPPNMSILIRQNPITRPHGMTGRPKLNMNWFTACRNCHTAAVLLPNLKIWVFLKASGLKMMTRTARRLFTDTF